MTPQQGIQVARHPSTMAARRLLWRQGVGSSDWMKPLSSCSVNPATEPTAILTIIEKLSIGAPYSGISFGASWRMTRVNHRVWEAINQPLSHNHSLPLPHLISSSHSVGSLAIFLRDSTVMAGASSIMAIIVNSSGRLSIQLIFSHTSWIVSAA